MHHRKMKWGMERGIPVPPNQGTSSAIFWFCVHQCAKRELHIVREVDYVQTI